LQTNSNLKGSEQLYITRATSQFNAKRKEVRVSGKWTREAHDYQRYAIDRNRLLEETNRVAQAKVLA